MQIKAFTAVLAIVLLLVAFATGKEVLAAAWLAAKAIDAWLMSDNDKRLYLMGSGLSILATFAGLGVTKCLMANRIGLAVAIVVGGFIASSIAVRYIDTKSKSTGRKR